MTEDEAQDWLRMKLNVSRETMDAIETFLAFLRREAQSQNLVSASTLDQVWARHIVDSAQLLLHLPRRAIPENWLDLGTGAGFPGLVCGLLTPHHFTLVESRARRIDYLERAIRLLDLESRVSIAAMPVEKLKTAPFSVISARAFAPLPRLLPLAHRFSTANTFWLLPKGRNAVTELSGAKEQFDLDFTLLPSVTDAESGILAGYMAGSRPNRDHQRRNK